MVKADFYNYRNAEAILEKKGLLVEIKDIIERVPSLGRGIHDVLSGYFREKEWEIKVNLLSDTKYIQDAYKDKIMVEIDLRGSLLDSVHRNFLRAQELYNRKMIEVLVQITEMEYEPKYHNMRRDIETFKSVLTVPIYLIGLR